MTSGCLDRKEVRGAIWGVHSTTVCADRISNCPLDRVLTYKNLIYLLNLQFSSPPHTQPLRFESLSLKTTQTVPPTPGTALHNKIESRLEKSVGSQFNIQLQQQMGVFQASMLEAMKSLRDEMYSMKKASESDVVQTSVSLPKAGPSKQPDRITTQTSISMTRASDHSDAQPMDTDHYGPPLPPKSTQSVQALGYRI